jgi:transposase
MDNMKQPVAILVLPVWILVIPVGFRRAGFTQNEISRDLNIRQGTVSKILRRHSQRRTVKLKASSGRPRKTSARDDRILYRICRSNRMFSRRELWQNRINIRLSRATVNRRLLSRGLKAYRPVQRPLLNDLRKQRRLLWAQQHRRYDWRRIGAM